MLVHEHRTAMARQLYDDLPVDSIGALVLTHNVRIECGAESRFTIHQLIGCRPAYPSATSCQKATSSSSSFQQRCTRRPSRSPGKSTSPCSNPLKSTPSSLNSPR